MEKEKASKKKKVLLIGLGFAATGLLSYFGWNYYQKKKKEKEDAESDSSSDKMLMPPQQSTFTPNFFQQKRNDNFPLKKGSKGAKVKAIQDSLIAKHGSGILPKYGADGDFGTELDTALKKLSLPAVIDESAYNVIVQSPAVKAADLANALYKDAVNKNLSAVIATLRKMRTKEDYTAVSNEFKKYKLRGVSQTLVNGLLGSFPDEGQKQQVRLEFLRMGLKYDGSKWSLSGLDGFRVMTTEPAIVWRSPKEGAKVPANMILGTEVATREGYTLFENSGRKFIVKSKSIKFL